MLEELETISCIHIRISCASSGAMITHVSLVKESTVKGMLSNARDCYAAVVRSFLWWQIIMGKVVEPYKTKVVYIIVI